MPRVFKVPFGRADARQHSKFWYCRINGKKVSLQTTDKRLAEQKASELEKVAALGYDPGAMDRHKKRPILEHLVAFEDALKLQGVGHGHLQNLVPRLQRLFAECGIKTIADIDGRKVEEWLARLQLNGDMAVGTRKHYAANAKQFGRWLVKTDRVSRSPFTGLRTDLNVEAARVYSRRALTHEDCQHFLTTVRASAARRAKMVGEDRYFLYTMALATGLRRNELGRLSPSSFTIDSTTKLMVVTVTATWTKNHKVATLPVREDVAAELQTWLAGRPADQLLFPVYKRRMGYMIQADLADAGIAHEVAGRVVDFHSLRGTFITHLGLAGVPLVVAQKLARHSTPVLTANTYTHLGMADLAAAVAKLPSLGRKVEPGE